MKKWKLHTPEGVLDVLENECAKKRQVEDAIRRSFHSEGYFEVQTPSFEFLDVFYGEGGSFDQSEMIKFFDRSGRIMALRPDMTTSIARICATKYHDGFPKRLCYVGSAFRDGSAAAGVLQKEFTQAGIELIGQSGSAADAEVIAAAVRALLACGMTEFQLDIGQAEFFKGIMEQADLDDETAEQMRRLIDQKSFVAVEELVSGLHMDDDLKALILSLPNLFGGIEVIDKIKTKPLGARARAALANLVEIYDILRDYGVEKYISIDLGQVQEINYYTGVIVKGFTYGMGFPICGGGRYDNLIGEFGGTRVPATGIAIGIERVISALRHAEFAFELPCAHTLVCTDGHRRTAFRIAEGLRHSGLCVETWNGEGAEDYARFRGMGGIVRVIDQDTLDVINLNDGQTTRTSISELIGGDFE
ncbi:ATP phosphoribosyltransferase regulatory subunit [Clostridia bacterium]|nr:ATP phosphoribosyltransferase regulatory subunit [Clostridia bacterium]